MKSSPEALAMGLAGLLFFGCVTVLFNPGTVEGWRIVAVALLVPALALYLIYTRRYWRAWKEYQADCAAKREQLDRDIKAENMRRYLDEG